MKNLQTKSTQARAGRQDLVTQVLTVCLVVSALLQTAPKHRRKDRRCDSEGTFTATDLYTL